MLGLCTTTVKLPQNIGSCCDRITRIKAVVVASAWYLPRKTSLPRWFPDGKRFAFAGNEPGRAVRFYVQNASAEKPQAISLEGVNAAAFVISPDGQLVAGIGPDQKGMPLPRGRRVSHREWF
jgi:Tol biopolymer transport system component